MEINKKGAKIKMKERIYHRFDMSNTKWKLIKPHLTSQSDNIAKDNWKFIVAIVWILKIGPP